MVVGPGIIEHEVPISLKCLYILVVPCVGTLFEGREGNGLADEVVIVGIILMVEGLADEFILSYERDLLVCQVIP